MTGGSGRDDAELPVFDAIEPPAVTLRATGRRTPPPRLGPGRGAGAAVAILVLLVSGIAVGGFSLRADPTGTPGPSPKIPTSASPAGSTEVGICRPPRQGQFPAVTMGVDGTRRQAAGLFGFGSGYGHQTQEPAWRVPSHTNALVASAGENLVVDAGLDTCFRHLVVEYRGTAREPGDVVVVLFNANVEPSTGRIVLDGLGDGDWIIRVTAHFDTLETVSEDIVTVTYFRILSGKGPFVTSPPTPAPVPTPFVSPAVPCGVLVPTAAVAVSLLVGSNVSAQGAVGRDAIPAEVHGRIGDSIRMVIDGDACAVGWSISVRDTDTTEDQILDAVSNPAEDPGYAAQNRWAIPLTGQSQIVTAVLQFPGRLEVVRTWIVTIDPFQIPALFLVGPDGKRFEASPGCGLGIHLSNGYEGSDSCGSIGYAPGPEALRVRAYRAIHLDLPGWQIVSWSAVCGRVTTVDTEQFDSPDGCGLGGGGSEDGGPLPDRPAFVLPPGDTVVQIGIAAVDDSGNQFNVAYYAHVIAR